MLARMGEVLGDDKTWGLFGSIFAQMEVAEEEIEKAQGDYPEKADLLWNCFGIMPSPIVNGEVPLPVFRVHCRQLLRNVAEGVNLDRPTLAEVVVMTLRGCTHTVPPNSELSHLILTDKETVEAFGQKAHTASWEVNPGIWVELTQMAKRVYTAAKQELRSKQFKRLAKRPKKGYTEKGQKVMF